MVKMFIKRLGNVLRVNCAYLPHVCVFLSLRFVDTLLNVIQFVSELRAYVRKFLENADNSIYADALMFWRTC